jgi:hypothetical protein
MLLAFLDRGMRWWRGEGVDPLVWARSLCADLQGERPEVLQRAVEGLYTVWQHAMPPPAYIRLAVAAARVGNSIRAIRQAIHDDAAAQGITDVEARAA